MIGNQLYEKIVKVKSAKQSAKLISAVLSYILYLVIWIFIGLLDPENLILIFIGGILSDALIILITLKYLFLEYEYSFCMNDLSIAKIYGKKKRKAVIKTDIKELVLIAPATEENIAAAERLEPASRIIAVSNERAENIWLLVTGEENEPREMIFIEADERILGVLKSHAPSVFPKNV